MKRLRILSIFMVLFAVLGGIVASCETEPVDPLLLTDDNGGTDTIADPGIFTVKIGGTLFVADSTIATLGNGQIVIKGYKGTEGENVTITVPSTTTGTYTAVMIYDPGTSANFYSNVSPSSGPSGSATITTINTAARVISGSFNFTGYYSDTAQNLPNVAFTEGIFTNISYAGGTPPTNPSGPGSFKVDFSGQTFVADTIGASVGNALFAIGGIRGVNGETVGILVNEPIVQGTTYTNVFFNYYTDVDDTNDYNNADDEGSLTITEYNTVNHTISGTFHFVGVYTDTSAGRPNITFTNGVFTNVPYNVETNPDVFTATIDGVATDYSSDLISGIANTTINIQAVGTSNEIRFALINTIAQGTYVFSDAINSNYKAVFEKDNVDYNITGGSLVVISNNGERIKGTFSFDVKDSTGAVIHTVTNGAFDIGYDE